MSTLFLLFRDFKRHYRKIESIYSRLSDAGPFVFRVKGDQNTVSAEHITPDQEETVRFVVLMRRFLSPTDRLYYGSVWALLREQFGDVIGDEVSARIETLIESLQKGQLGINVNGDQLTAERIYQLLADGEYFNQIEDAQAYLKGLAGIPIVGPLFWFQFHSYTLAGLELIAALSYVIGLIQKSEKFRSLSPDPTSSENYCIYCRETTGGFTSEEHIIPESLGNDELVLPRGFVCDKCNNGVLAELDSVLLKFEPIAMLQVQFVPYTKDGKLPKANFQNLTIRRTSPRSITVQAKDRTGRIRNKKHLGDGRYTFSLNMRGKPLDPKQLGRALYKVGLGMVALGQGHEQACDPRFDEARNYIRFGKGFPNNLLIKTECKPRPQVTVSYSDLPEGTPVIIDVYGLTFILNLEAQPVIELNEILVQAKFAQYSLRGI